MRHLMAGLLVLLILPLQAGAGPLTRLADIAIGTDDNISAAADTRPRATEQFLQAGLGLTFSEPIAPGMTLRLLGRADGRLHARYEGLNEIAGSAEGQLVLRSGNGFYSPTLGASAGIGVSEFNSALRDLQESRLRLFARQTLTTRLMLRGSVFALWREADSKVFDAEIHGAETALDWQASPQLTLTLGYQYRDGEVVSSSVPGALARANAIALVADDVFAEQTALSFEAQTHIGTVTANYALTSQLALDVQLRYIESDPRFDARYHRWTTLSGLLLRF